jgi:hypothetical protein
MEDQQEFIRMEMPVTVMTGPWRQHGPTQDQMVGIGSLLVD